MFSKIDKSWHDKLKNEIEKPYFKNLIDFLNFEYNNRIIYPPIDKILFCLEITKFFDIKVVLVGQDPYCYFKQAHGLAFSVPFGVKIPQTLLNIHKELYNDMGINNFNNGNLLKWASQGVLLLNTVLTVEHSKPGSHFNVGWEFFTNFIIKILSEVNNNIIFVLWGKKALELNEFIDLDNNIILYSTHPSPLSASKGFFGSRPFSKINLNLKMLRKKEINWDLNG